MQKYYMKIMIFWDVTPCNLIESYHRFGGIHCLHHHSKSNEPSGETVRNTGKRVFAPELLAYQ
jgi:hypothetical protein